MEVLGLDIGSSSMKGAILDLTDLAIREVAVQPFPGPRPGLPTGWHEVDADEVVDGCRQLIDGLLRTAQPQAILLCGQHGMAMCWSSPATRRRIGHFVSVAGPALQRALPRRDRWEKRP